MMSTIEALNRDHPGWLQELLACDVRPITQEKHERFWVLFDKFTAGLPAPDAQQVLEHVRREARGGDGGAYAIQFVMTNYEPLSCAEPDWGPR